MAMVESSEPVRYPASSVRVEDRSVVQGLAAGKRNV